MLLSVPVDKKIGDTQVEPVKILGSQHLVSGIICIAILCNVLQRNPVQPRRNNVILRNPAHSPRKSVKWNPLQSHRKRKPLL